MTDTMATNTEVGGEGTTVTGETGDTTTATGETAEAAQEGEEAQPSAADDTTTKTDEGTARCSCVIALRAAGYSYQTYYSCHCSWKYPIAICKQLVLY